MRNVCVRALAALSLCLGLGSVAEATIWQVNAGAGCPGSGTLAAPFCTIGGGAAVAVAGDTVNVAPGVYREQVTPPASGSSGLPITYVASGEGARVLGTENLSGAGLWTLATATAWSTPFVPTTNTAQVFVDGERLAEAASVAALVADSFFFDSTVDVLYVDVGGPNPGLQTVEAGARSFGFDVNGRSFIVIQGFEVRGQNSSAIRVRNSADVIVRGNLTVQADAFGILAESTTGPVEISDNEATDNAGGGIRTRIASGFVTGVADATVRNNFSHENGNHGLLATATTGSLFAGNVFRGNLRPTGVSTTGLILDGDSDGNVVERNLSFDNQDSGFQVSGGADGNTFVRNISHANGDHGFDVRECVSTRLISNTSWGNTNDGFSLEGAGTTNATLANNIATANGGFQLFVRENAVGGFASDYDVFFGGATPISFDGMTHASVAAFQDATVHEDHGIGADPLFTDPSNGDFHPGVGAWLDSADASVAGFQAADFDGLPPLDLPDVPNMGAGVPNFADRGALEHVVLNEGPSARLDVSPRRIEPGGMVTADASRSSDDTGIVNYHFDWGDGSPATDQPGPIAMHSYAGTGVHHVRLTVTDGAGLTATHQQPVQVREPVEKGPKPGKGPKK